MVKFNKRKNSGTSAKLGYWSKKVNKKFIENYRGGNTHIIFCHKNFQFLILYPIPIQHLLVFS